MRDPIYEEREQEAEDRLFRQGGLFVIITCHLLSALQWACYLLGGSYWGG